MLAPVAKKRSSGAGLVGDQLKRAQDGSRNAPNGLQRPSRWTKMGAVHSQRSAISKNIKKVIRSYMFLASLRAQRGLVFLNLHDSVEIPFAFYFPDLRGANP